MKYTAEKRQHIYEKHSYKGKRKEEKSFSWIFYVSDLLSSPA